MSSDGNRAQRAALPRRMRGKRWGQRGAAIYVGPGSAWANPFDVDEQVQVTTATDLAMIPMTPEIAQAAFRDLLEARLTFIPHDHPEDREWTVQWRTELAALHGKDLECECPLDRPCHADVLLEEANR